MTFVVYGTSVVLDSDRNLIGAISIIQPVALSHKGYLPKMIETHTE